MPISVGVFCVALIGQPYAEFASSKTCEEGNPTPPRPYIKYTSRQCSICSSVNPRRVITTTSQRETLHHRYPYAERASYCFITILSISFLDWAGELGGGGGLHHITGKGGFPFRNAEGVRCSGVIGRSLRLIRGGLVEYPTCRL